MDTNEKPTEEKTTGEVTLTFTMKVSPQTLLRLWRRAWKFLLPAVATGAIWLGPAWFSPSSAEPPTSPASPAATAPANPAPHDPVVVVCKQGG